MFLHPGHVVLVGRAELWWALRRCREIAYVHLVVALHAILFLNVCKYRVVAR